MSLSGRALDDFYDLIHRQNPPIHLAPKCQRARIGPNKVYSVKKVELIPPGLAQEPVRKGTPGPQSPLVAKDPFKGPPAPQKKVSKTRRFHSRGTCWTLSTTFWQLLRDLKTFGGNSGGSKKTRLFSPTRQWWQNAQMAPYTLYKNVHSLQCCRSSRKFIIMTIIIIIIISI